MAKLVAMNNPYNTNLDRNPANFQPLTPLTFLERAASVYPNHTAIVHGKLRRNYSDFYSRSRQLASALSATGYCSRRYCLGNIIKHARDAGGPLWRSNVWRSFTQH